MKKIKVATVFSGIGAIEFALKRMSIDYEIAFACDNGEREIIYDSEEELKKIKAFKTVREKYKYVEELYSKSTRKTNFVKISYLANYDCQNERFFQDIKLLDGTDFANQIDLFVGGSPCQSFSLVGNKGGLEDTRGTLFYEFARLVKEIQPKVFIYENVKNLMNHNNGKTWEIIKEVFESLGYSYKYAVLNSSDYGIPQTRRRLFVVGFKEKNKYEMPNKFSSLKFKMNDFLENNCYVGGLRYDSKGDIIIENKCGTVDKKYFLTPKLYAYVMKSGTKNFRQNPIINLDIARTLLKTMGNRHRAGIDNYVSIDGSNKLGKVRMLTEREAHRLMGFTDDYKIVVSRSQAYKQAGNSIVVDVLIEIVKEIIKTGIFE